MDIVLLDSSWLLSFYKDTPYFEIGVSSFSFSSFSSNVEFKQRLK
ncbi:hypothetical protein GPAL_3166 [Glaciecola pallidula DSM 14239 = ACAM 615]|uniref:Uncharacterized protein n=1 Tax=Brumicola pallidula DSM 14239 = ACAM 615 TaxID=1121922 RepID=K6ZI41_9ALTE|nr:hypothetical protein GPAL_3166 [Glaciecola pallidula DSM 14239 = ACAM 615]